jgi:hypothetical protein
MKMNYEYKLNDDQLRLASRHLPPGTSLDTETAAARDHFLTLGAALESAPGEIDESAIIARLSREQTCSRPPATNNAWPLLLCCALAASALVAIVRIATMPADSNPQIAVLTEPNPKTHVPQHAPATDRTTAAWNDPLDYEIALAAATLEQYRSRSPSFDNSLFDMNIQLEALSQELLRESL